MCEVKATDYVPALLEGAGQRANAKRRDIRFQKANADALPFADGSFDALTSSFCVMFTPDQDGAAADLIRVCSRHGKLGLANWRLGGLNRPTLPRHRYTRHTTYRRMVTGSVGHAATACRNVRAQCVLYQSETTRLRLPLTIAGALAGGIQDLIRSDSEGVRPVRRWSATCGS